MFESFLSFILSFFVTTEVATPISVPTPHPVVVIEAPKKINPEDAPLSFRSFLDQDFVGNDFKVGNLLNDWGTHKSYYATYNSNGFTISGTWHVPKGNGPFPLLILNHGYFPPSTYTNGFGFGREQKYFARNGYAVFHTDYRNYAFSDKDSLNYTEGQRFGQTGYATDSVNAILAIQAANVPNIDTSRVGMLGHSLGGGVTLNASLARPDLIDVGVMWGPISSNYEDNFNKWTRQRLTSEGKQVFEEAFGSIDSSDSFKYVSSRTYLSELQVPLLIQHGTADEACPIAWSRETTSELARLDKAFSYIEYPDVPHVFWDGNWNRAAAEALKYLDLHLKNL